jgi:hypothetical protein
MKMQAIGTFGCSIAISAGFIAAFGYYVFANPDYLTWSEGGAGCCVPDSWGMTLT